MISTNGLSIFLLLSLSTAALASSSELTSQTSKGYNVCLIAEVEKGTPVEKMATNLATPILAIPTYLTIAFASGRIIPQNEAAEFNSWLNSFSVEVVKEPKHGKLFNDRDLKNPVHKFYAPNNGYYGKDESVIVATGKDRNGHFFSLKLHYHIGIFPIESELESDQDRNYAAFRQKACGTTRNYWLISNVKVNSQPKR